MLCQDMPAPPAGVSTGRDDLQNEHTEELSRSSTTNRRRYHLLTESQSCARCHAELINPLGFALEDFDTVGRFRSQDANGNQIDASGALFSPFQQLQFFNDNSRDLTSIAFNGGKGVAQVMSELPQAQDCVSEQIMSYATGLDVGSINGFDRPDVLSVSNNEQHGYQCDVQDMTKTMMDNSPRAMLEALGTLETIRYRKPWSR